MSDDIEQTPLRRAGTTRRFQPVREEAREQNREASRAPEGERLYRRRTKTTDPIGVDPSIIPDGFAYEWKTESVVGKPAISHMNELKENHWAPVPAERHPHMVANPDTERTIRRDGLVLMERPLYLSEEAAAEEYDIAMGEVQKKEQQVGRPSTPAGTMTRDHPSVRRASYLIKEKEPIRRGALRAESE